MRMSIALSSFLVFASSRSAQSFTRKTPTAGVRSAFISSSSSTFSSRRNTDGLKTHPKSLNANQDTYSYGSAGCGRRTANRFSSALSVSTSPTQQSSSTQPIRIQKAVKLENVEPLKVNLLTIHQEEFEILLKSWNQPKYRAKQVLEWVRTKGISSFDDMSNTNIPKKLIKILEENTTIGSLKLDVEAVSKDGTIKRAYRLHDNQLIESVLMPYQDGRNTACISSQAGCAMGCVFCATGQMGFARQLTSDEIYEQVAKFDAELRGRGTGERLSNVVMMGMGEPLANYRNVMEAIKRMNSELGIGARKITVSTVGVVPNIKKLMNEDIQVRLAVSLHCSSEEERSQLLPANKRYGGLDELMNTIRDYIDTTNRRVTLEWALIENENDTPEVARDLGRLLRRFGIRRDMTHVNLIPLNPTGGFEGGPSGRRNVNEFVRVLDDEFGIKATPRVRRGIDINAGCGQLKAAVEKKERKEQELNEKNDSNPIDELKSFVDNNASEGTPPPIIGVYEDDEDEEDESVNLEPVNLDSLENMYTDRIRQTNELQHGSIVEFEIHDSINLDEDGDFEDESYENDLDMREAARLINLIQTSSPAPPPKVEDETLPTLIGPTTTILDEESVRKAKKRRKKLLKNLKAINKLKDLETNGKILNEEQMQKIKKEEEWQLELESVEHNLQ